MLQESFDEAVSENMETFDMTVSRLGPLKLVTCIYECPLLF